jgi:hypothetical protein
MCPRTISIIAPVWPLALNTGTHSAWFEAVLSGFRSLKSMPCQEGSEGSTRCIVIVRELQNTMSFMSEWQTAMQGYGLD